MAYDYIKLEYKQIINGKVEAIFPLLCPQKERLWLKDWDFEWIYSKSGFNERDAVFSTCQDGQEKAIWYTTIYDIINRKIEFIKITPKYLAVRINIDLKENSSTTKVNISYRYTALSLMGEEFIKNEASNTFSSMMIHWEKAMNHYLKTGLCL